MNIGKNISSSMKIPSKKYPHISFENGIWRGEEIIFSETVSQPGNKLMEILKQSPDFIGQIDSVTGSKDTFGEMLDRSVRCALWLKKQGIGPGDVVTLCTYNDFNTVIPILACLYIGCILNTFLMNSLDDDLTAYFFNTVEPKIVFAHGEATELVTRYNKINGKDVKIVTFQNSPNFPNFNEILKESSINDVQNFQCYEIPSLDAPAMIRRCGTTGLPKAFVVPYRQFVRPCLRPPEEMDYGSVITWRSRVCWLFVIRLAILSIQQKLTFVIIPSELKLTEFCEMIQKYKINRIEFDVNGAIGISQLENISDYDFTAVKLVGWVGARTRNETQEKLAKIFPNAWLSQLYGVSEFGSMTCGMRDCKIGSCGIPMPNVELKIKNESGEIINEPNKLGQIYARCPNFSVTYYKKPEESKKALDSDGWCITGDLGYYDEDGEFFIVDRIKEFIRFRTADVSPSVIEELISKHPAVADVAVVAKFHDEDIEQPMAFVVKKADGQVTKEKIMELVEKNLLDHMRLRGGVAFIDKMPYNSAGKVDRMNLRRIANNC